MASPAGTEKEAGHRKGSGRVYGFRVYLQPWIVTARDEDGVRLQVEGNFKNGVLPRIVHITHRLYYVWFKSWYIVRERTYLERPSFEVMREGERWARRQALKYLKEGRRPSVAEVMSVPWKGGT